MCFYCACKTPLVQGKKGTGGDSDKEGEGQGQEEGGGDAPPAKKPPTKKEQRRLDEQERLRREAEVWHNMYTRALPGWAY